MSTSTSRSGRGPQWANSYEAQLSDEQLRKLHEQLLARSPSDREIRESLPPWKHGPRAGQKPSPATLSSIRDRLEAEEQFAAAARDTQSLVAERLERDPGLTLEEQDAFATRAFNELAIARRDVKTWRSLKAMRDRAALETAKLKLAEMAEQRQREALQATNRQIDLAERRVVMLEAKLRSVSEAVTAAREGGLTPEALSKIEAAARLL